MLYLFGWCNLIRNLIRATLWKGGIKMSRSKFITNYRGGGKVDN